jgi:hypothetical protein
MCNKTPVALTIATILTVYVSALSLSNQAFAQRTSTTTSGINFYFGGNFLAQPSNGGPVSSNQAQPEGQHAGVDGGTGHVTQGGIGKVFAGPEAQLGKVLAGEEAQAGKVLTDEGSHHFDVGHEAQLGQPRHCTQAERQAGLC